MKKLALALMACLMLVGCTQKQHISTFMIEDTRKLHALYNSKGEQLTDFNYKSFKEMSGYGYIVTNAKDEVGFISLEGEIIIPFGSYATLDITASLLYATKKVEKDNAPVDGIDHDNVYLIKPNGNVIYSAGKDVGIFELGDSKVNPYAEDQLPIVYKGDECIVLYKNGLELMSGMDIVSAYQYDNAKCVCINYKTYSILYDYQNYEEGKETELPVKGEFAIVGVDPIKHESAMLYDYKQKSVVGVDLVNCQSYLEKLSITGCEYDFANNIILKQNDKSFAYMMGAKPVELNTYYMSGDKYLFHMSNVYGPHRIYDKDKTVDIADCQLYPKTCLLYRDIYPVFVKKKGYMFYDFKGKPAFKDVYIDAEPFDANGNAIVKKDDKGYSLIGETGNVKTSKTYAKIELLGGGYYAAFNKNGGYGIINASGEEVLPCVYTTLPDSAYILYRNKEYLLLNKNGRSCLYDVAEDMEEIESIEGSLEFNKKGYFTDGSHYYTFKGELIR